MSAKIIPDLRSKVISICFLCKYLDKTSIPIFDASNYSVIDCPQNLGTSGGPIVAAWTYLILATLFFHSDSFLKGVFPINQTKFFSEKCFLLF